ncbi:GGDEF domain-containing protein [Lysobacter enzymogenes]|nr:GGDEF domain-containing protein [Lysobacter enzymogenes]QCW25186.1 GGDEF domain-containing protein [Lysobacter enzymogenes]
MVVSVPRYRDGAFAGVIEASLAPAHVYDENGHGDYETVLLDRAGRVIHASGGIGLKFMQRAADTGFAPALAQRDGGAARRAVPVMPDGGHASSPRPAPAAAGPCTRWRRGTGRAPGAGAGDVDDPVAAAGGARRGVGVRVVCAGAGARILAAAAAAARAGQRRRAGASLPAGDVPMPEELQPVLAAIVDLSTRLDHAHAELRQSLAEREHDVAQRTEQLRAALRELDRVACTDPLTGALNRRGRDEFVQALAAQGARLGSVAVLLLDVDHFKAYNDRYGHRAGDEALRTAVAAIRAEVREGDDAVVRAGGEEFCVLIPGVGRARVLNIARAILLGLYRRDIEHRDSEHGRLTCSIGVAMAYSVDELDAAMDRADEALYRAKRRGRNGFCS